MMRWGSAAVVVALATSPGTAQDADDVQRFARQMRELQQTQIDGLRREGSLEERLYLNWGGAARFSVASIDDATSESRVLRRSEARLQVEADLDGVHQALVRLRFRYDDWNAGDSFDGRGDEFETQIADRFWYQYTGGEPGRALRLRIGKQYVHWNSGLALSNVLYAGRLEADWGGWSAALLAGRTPSLTVDFDGSRPGFDRHTRRDLAGLQVQKTVGRHHPYLSALVQKDRNQRDRATFLDRNGQLFTTRFAEDSEYYSAGMWGELGSSWIYDTELCIQRGRGLSSPRGPNGLPVAQSREDLSAWALSALLARSFAPRLRARAEAQLLAGSGDEDRLDATDTFGGNQSGTTDRSFRSLGFPPTGLALSPALANLGVLRVGASAFPFVDQGGSLRELRIGLDVYGFAKLRPRAPLDVATDQDRLVGGEVDLSLDWNLTSDLSLDLRAGVFFPGPAMPRGQDGTREVLLMGLTYVF